MEEWARALIDHILGTEGRVPPDAFPADPSASRFLDRCRKTAVEELANRAAGDDAFHSLADSLQRSGAGGASLPGDAWWPLLFPEGAGLMADPEAAVSALRSRRAIRVTRANPEPVRDPLRELLFTSNILLTLPADTEHLEGLDLEESLKARIRAACSEQQAYFYDHPIHLGEAPETNEAVYGLRGLDQAVAWEKDKGGAAPGDKATVLLSVSVTHASLREIAVEYIRSLLASVSPMEQLRVYIFSELDCRRIVRDALAPHLISTGAPGGDGEDEVRRVLEVFGVDGEYGRHYSFLKAVAAFWQVFVDPAVRATFKIDLDQVFPQDALLSESGTSAFGHFRTPLWGARGLDSEGREVELGMLAGALVNEKDIGRGLFTPDVTLPEGIPPGEAKVFFNRIPMALSTRAEMMLRYREGSDFDGTRLCSQRFHVTGGTNGILVDALRRHRPFTPTFIGRAEDQAYILSVLYRDGPPHLRYLHEPGLIMRHDKEAFAGPAIEAARLGRFTGDLARTYFFSRYASALPWGFGKTKAQADPFTGCFITRLPWTIIYLRLCLKAAEAAREGDGEEARALLTLAADRLSRLLDMDEGRERSVADRNAAESEAWDLYYDALDSAEARPAGDRLAQGRRLVEPCRVS